MSERRGLRERRREQHGQPDRERVGLAVRSRQPVGHGQRSNQHQPDADQLLGESDHPRTPAVTAPAIPVPSPMNPGAGPNASARAGRPHTRRNIELGMLLFSMAVVAVFAGVVEGNMIGSVTPDFWVPTAMLTVIFVAVHMAIRFLAPYADPALLPAVALINGLGVAFLRRIDLAARVKAPQR